MPFTNAMTFPTELTLKTKAHGIRLQSWPVKEIAQLHEGKRDWHDLTLQPGANPLQGISGGAFDITGEFQLPQPGAGGSGADGLTFGFQIGSPTIRWR